MLKTVPRNQATNVFLVFIYKANVTDSQDGISLNAVLIIVLVLFCVPHKSLALETKHELFFYPSRSKCFLSFIIKTIKFRETLARRIVGKIMKQRLILERIIAFVTLSGLCLCLCEWYEKHNGKLLCFSFSLYRKYM